MVAAQPSNPNASSGFLADPLTRCRENPLYSTTVSDRDGESPIGANEIRSSGGAEDRHIRHAVAHVVELGVAKMRANGLELPIALRVVAPVAGDHGIEHTQVFRHSICDALVCCRRQRHALTPGALPLDELEHVGAIWKGNGVELHAMTHEFLEACSPREHDKWQRWDHPRPIAHQTREREMQRVAVDEGSIQIHYEWNWINHGSWPSA